jgi:ketosteroid isomerase-like protein
MEVVMRTGIALLLVCLAVPAFADDAADAKAQTEAFVRAWDKGDVKAALALYADDARVIWPGQGDEVKGKAAVEELLARTFEIFPKSGLALKSQDTIPLGNGYIGNVCYFDQTVPGPDGKPATFRVRTTEILKRQGGKLVYVVDHASIGLAAPPSPH